MIVCFRAENFRSIRAPIELNLRAAPRLRKHADHILQPDESRSNLKLLKTAIIYGANASGKSNIVKALSFFQDLVTKERHAKENIACEPFKLTSNVSDTSSFYLEFTTGSSHFGYEVEHNADCIKTEKLSLIDNKNIAHNIYSRVKVGDDFKFDSTAFLSPEQKDLIEHLAKYSQSNSTLLSEFYNNDNIYKDLPEHFRLIIYHAYSYIKHCIIAIYPHSKWGGYSLEENADSSVNCFKMMSEFDTGVSEVNFDKLDINIFPDHILKTVYKRLDENNESFVHINYKGINYSIRKVDGVPYAFLANFKHRTPDGKVYSLANNEESDGTLRLVDLLPIIREISDPEAEKITYVIDEFDRSLHPNLAKLFLKKFLSSDSEAAQLIVTTHQPELLNLDDIRRDEIWFVQKEWNHSTTLYSLNDYSVRHDKSIREAYLQGVYGGIPVFNESLDDM